MEIQNNLNKAKELDEKFKSFLYSPKEGTSFQQCLLEMAEWKEKQMIENAVKWLENNIHDYYDGNSEFAVCNWLKEDEFINNFKKAMEE